MAYQKQTWNNDDTNTPLSAERLTHIEEGIAAADAVTPADLAGYDPAAGHGKLPKVKADGSGFEFIDPPAVPAAATWANLAGKPAPAAAVTDLEAAPTAADVNKILAIMRSWGMIAAK